MDGKFVYIRGGETSEGKGAAFSKGTFTTAGTAVQSLPPTLLSSIVKQLNTSTKLEY